MKRVIEFTLAIVASVLIATPGLAQGTQCAGAGQDKMIILFDFDSSVVKENYHQPLKQWATRAQQRLIVCVVGMADKMGSTDYNQKLALRRAEAVAKMLEDEGIKRSVMDVRSEGESFFDNLSVAQRDVKQARRVEISYGR